VEIPWVLNFSTSKSGDRCGDLGNFRDVELARMRWAAHFEIWPVLSASQY
jgi:hypothetical protein